VILFTRGLPYVQCTKNRLTRENYIAKYKIFQEHQLNSRRFPGVGKTLQKHDMMLGVSGDWKNPPTALIYQQGMTLTPGKVEL